MSSFFACFTPHSTACAASELSFGAVSLNLLSSIRNPFSSPSAHNIKSFLIINGASLAGAFALLASGLFGRSLFHICYIVKHTTIKDGVNPALWLLFNLPLFVIWVFSSGVGIFAARRLSKGLRGTFEAKTRALRRERTYIILYTLYWFITGTLYCAASFSSTDGDSDTWTDDDKPAVAFTLLFTAKSLGTLVVREALQRDAGPSLDTIACSLSDALYLFF